ncbi:MAG: serine/threonine protein kinase [Actinobacteria bacterium]|nr:serine/threonine protein kinase [Actinomycetota bacterium]MBI3686234.1 serine/threonine protein kinase [Actinomycetota bacterium]
MTPEVEPEHLLSGRYRVDALLGRGGMSEVYHGHDERLDRAIAIKMLRQPTHARTGDGPEAQELLDAQQRDRARFLREIRTAAQLEHPGTPAVYDTGIDEQPDGSTRIWLVMQLLRGSTLEGLLDRTDYEAAPPPISWAAAIGAQIAAVLADVHRVDIVHRDIKPANIMVIDGGVVKVLDFGIAILRGAGALPRLTQVDRTVGTPTYMSPEQHLGRAVTAASDIYSLGCLMFELLTGDPPFLDTPNASLRAHHIQSPAPSARATRADIPEPVEQLLHTMLAKDPDSRPSAEQVYRTLVTFTHTPGAGVGGANRDPTRPFRTPLLAPPPPRQPAGGGAPLTDAEFEQIRVSVAALLDSGDNTGAVRLLEAGLRRSSANPFFELELQQLLGLALFYVGEYRRAAALLAGAGKRYRAGGLVASHPRVLECAYHAGHAYAEIGAPAPALAHLRYFTSNVEADDPDNAERVLESRFVIAQMLATEQRTAEARAVLEELRPAFRITYGPHSTHLINLERQIERLRQV